MSGDAREANRRSWEAVGAWSTSPRMNDMEAVMWRAERHPSLSSTIVAIELLDSAPEWKRLRDAHQWGSELIDRFRQRVVDPFPHLQPPEWEEDPGFDVDEHLRRVTIGPDAEMPELLELAESIAMDPLDRSRPLWEATLVDGLAGGRSAYVLKSHHSLSDGIAGVQLFAGMHSRIREPSTDKPAPEREDPGAGTATSGRLDPRGLAGRIPGAGTAASAVARGIPAAAGAIAHPRTTIAGGMRMTGSLRRVLGAELGAPSPLFGSRTGESWRFEALECSLDDLKGAARSTGATLNDAYVAALLGGIHAYHRAREVELETLPISMPVSVRDPDDPSGGNRFTAISLCGPAGIADPAERMAAIHGAVLAARAEPALDVTGMIAPVMSRMPSTLVLAARARVGAGSDLAASNFPGINREAYMAGARVERMYAFGPLPGAAMMATLVSHNGVCCISLNCDGTAIDEPAEMRRAIAKSLDEVIALGRPARPAPEGGDVAS